MHNACKKTIMVSQAKHHMLDFLISSSRRPGLVLSDHQLVSALDGISSDQMLAARGRLIKAGSETKVALSVASVPWRFR